jgi:Photosynthetic reaction centre cytochrome C subunit
MRKLSVLLIMILIAGLFELGMIPPAKKSAMIFSTVQDSLETDRLKYMNEVMTAIKGKEKMPADSVFKNLKVIKGITAEHLLWMMNWGWSAELGVSCSHCHTIGKWESDSLPTKNIARGMWQMRVKINNEILPGITGMNYDLNPKVTCLTCHRGKAVPITE